MKAEWFYAKNKQKVGPVTEEQLKELLRSGELTRSDMVWKEGMTKWMEAGQVKGLVEKDEFQRSRTPEPPPLPAEQENLVVGENEGKQSNATPTLLALILAAALALSLCLTCLLPSLLGSSTEKADDWFVPLQEMQAQRRREAPAKLSLSFFLFLDVGLALALGLLLYESYRRKAVSAANSLHQPLWVLVWRMKYALFGAVFVWFLFLCSGVSALEDVLPSLLGGAVKALYVLLMIGLFGALIVTGMMALIRASTRAERETSLWGKWEPVSGDGCSLWFYQDGGFLRNDGFGAKYTFDHDKDTIKVNVEGFGQPIPLKVITITKHELIVDCGGQALHFKKGKTITDERWEESVERSKEFLKQAALVTGAVTVGVIGLGVVVLGAAAVAAGGASGGGGYGGGGSGSGDSQFRQVPCSACFQKGWIAPDPTIDGGQNKVCYKCGGKGYMLAP